MIFLSFLLFTLTSNAMPTPPLESAWPKISLKLEIRNLTDVDGSGKLDEKDLRAAATSINEIWSECSIQFVLQKVRNVSAAALKVAYVPQGQEDLGKLEAALNPSGNYASIPLTIAGPWTFYDPASGVYPFGYGWVFHDGQKLNRIHAMISSTRFKVKTSREIMAHELGHALSLPENGSGDDIMGKGVGHVSMPQCLQTRAFAISALSQFRL
jgi:hypothetical protein